MSLRGKNTKASIRQQLLAERNVLLEGTDWESLLNNIDTLSKEELILRIEDATYIISQQENELLAFEDSTKTRWKWRRLRKEQRVKDKVHKENLMRSMDNNSYSQIRRDLGGLGITQSPKLLRSSD
eukprot:CAMPEP_0174251418 /NCGR_PEP_ID=MMETSP0439-20130205/1246_1 /TAXON_ID=0 /ORGANISM="Stereomyxa ramosa, Strain Chinc5" /LENGTH=125 /DNA_ID=CAMNT_0015331721 /DNA_START=267 /DNA_END=644 /DNA_ORIENTATION=+